MLKRLVECEDRGLPIVSQQGLNRTQDLGREFTGEHLAGDDVDRRALGASPDVDVASEA